MHRLVVEKLPKTLLGKANLNGNEYAWPMDVIPEVIETARKSNFLNIGGQLQFRIPNGGICECYWIQIDTYKSVSKNLIWAERVELAAKVALTEFQTILQSVDLVAEGRDGFATQIDKYIESGGDIHNVMCFVWYLSEE